MPGLGQEPPQPFDELLVRLAEVHHSEILAARNVAQLESRVPESPEAGTKDDTALVPAVEASRDFPYTDSEPSDEAAELPGVMQKQSPPSSHVKGCTSSDLQLCYQSSQASSFRKVEFPLKKWWAADLAAGVERKFSFSRRSSALMQVERARSQENLVVMSESRLQGFVLAPSSMKRMIWDIMSMTLLFYDIMVIPFVSAFQPPAVPFLVGMTWGTLIFWSMDMPLSMLTGFQQGKRTILAPELTFCHYMQTWFFLDAIIIGLDWVAVIFADKDTDGSAARLGRSLRTLRFVRTLRLLRVFKLKGIVQAVQDSITTEAVSIVFGVTKIIVGLVIANHVVACGWYSVGLLGDMDNASWIRTAGMESRSLVYRYTTSLHWSLTQFTPASMEVVPQTVAERIFAVNVILFAMIAFSSFVSLLTASMAQLQNLNSNESRQFWLLRRYLRDWGVRRRTAHRVQRYLEYAFHTQRQRVQDGDVKLLALLSEPLRLELRHETFSQYLRAHPLFELCCEQPRIFGKALMASQWAIGDLIFVAGQQCENLIFLTSGGLEYTLGVQDTPQNASATSRLSRDHIIEGAWVAEAALWTQWLHMGDLQAVTECQVLNVDSKEFGKAVQMHPPTWTAVRKYADKFVTALNQVDDQDLTDLCDQLFSPLEAIDREDFSFMERILDTEPESQCAKFLKPMSVFRKCLGRQSEFDTF